MILAEPSGRPVAVNRAFREAFGVDPPRAMAGSVAALFPSSEATRLRRAIEAALPGEPTGLAIDLGPDRTADLRISHVPPYLLIEAGVRTRAGAENGCADIVLEQLRAAVETLPDGFVLYDRDDRLVICNSKYKEIYTASAPAMIPGARFEDILRYGLRHGQYADGVGREEEWLAERMRLHDQAAESLEQHLADGRWLRILERHTPDGGRVGLRIDITNQVQSRQRAEKAEQRLRDAIEALPAGFWLFDANDRLIMFNERYRRMYASSAEILGPGVTFEDVLRFGLDRGQYPEAEGREEEWLQRVLEDRRKKIYELEYKLDNGRWIRSSNSPTSEGGYVGFRVDITELKTKQAELEKAAESDALTGLLNRRGLARLLGTLERDIEPSSRIVALHVDLDKFKAVNDAIGHDAGDHVLKAAARRMTEDCVPGEIVARIGGDEFLLVGMADAEDETLLARAEKLRRAITRPVVFQGRLCQVGATVGIGCWTKGADPVERVVADADIALNAGKRDGRNCTRLFTADMRRASVEQAIIAQEIREALENEQVEPWFQPQFAIDGQDVTGFESLARWLHPERGVISAGVFVPPAVEAGIAPDIDRVVREGSLAFLRDMTAALGGRPKLSINISSAQLSDASIVDQIDWQVDAYGLHPEQVRIEILESTLLDDRSSQIAENIRAFAARGYPIELDDFGTGHAAIASLRQYPVSRIKIDRSLVRGIDRDESSFVITETIVTLARKLGLEVLAEGVETANELAILGDIGCSAVQGYHLGRPMPAGDALAWLQDRPMDRPVQTSAKAAR